MFGTMDALNERRESMDKEPLKMDFDEFVKTGRPFDGAGQSSANATQVGGAHYAAKPFSRGTSLRQMGWATLRAMW